MTTRRLHATSRARVLLIAFSTLTLAGCDAKTASFFEALAAPPAPQLFPTLGELVGLTLTYSFVRTFSDCVNLPPDPLSSATATHSASGTDLMVLFENAPQGFVGVFLPLNGGFDGTTGPIPLPGGVFVEQHMAGVYLAPEPQVITFSGLFTTTISDATASCTIVETGTVGP